MRKEYCKAVQCSRQLPTAAVQGGGDVKGELAIGLGVVDGGALGSGLQLRVVWLSAECKHGRCAAWVEVLCCSIQAGAT